MLETYKKKVLNIYFSLGVFYKNYLPQIIFLILVFAVLFFLRPLPYFNIISHYYYFVLAVLWILSNFMFKKLITSKRVLIVGMLLFILVIPAIILKLDKISDSLGFGAFLLILTYVIRQMLDERKDLSSIK